MEEILRAIREVYNVCLAKEKNLDSRIAALAKQEAAVKVREDAEAEFDSAEELLSQAKAVAEKTSLREKELEEAKVAFENLCRKERQAIADELGRLAPLQDKEKQLFKDQQNLYAREEALAKEKAEFRDRYIEKIKAYFANTGKAPSANDIT